jgi:hypothetical protein
VDVRREAVWMIWIYAVTAAAIALIVSALLRLTGS